MENEWLIMNQKKINNIQYQLTELAYKNENPSVPLAQYRGMLSAAILEIKKLQVKINEQNSELLKNKG